MNGYENFYAGAFFFALISLGALLKLDASIGLALGAGCALVGALCLRMALNKSAQAAEEDHQRMEIQLQQLRTKIIETSNATVEAMTSVNEAGQLVQDNIQVIRVRLAELDSLSKLVENAVAIQGAINMLDENSSALNVELEKISIAISEHANPPIVVEELKKLTAIADENKSNLQNVAKLLQIVGQSLKNQPYAKDLTDLNATLDKLVKITADDNKADLQNISKLVQAVEQSQKNQPYAKDLNAIAATLDKLVKITADDNKADLQNISKLVQAVEQSQKNQPYAKDLNAIAATLDRLVQFTDEYNKVDLQNILRLVQLVEQSLDNQPYSKELSVINMTLERLIQVVVDAAKAKESALTDQDLSLLKKIAAKINIR